jgi:hypothetical protein
MADTHVSLSATQVINTTYQAAMAIGIVPNLATDSCGTSTGDKFVNTGREFVYIANGSGGSSYPLVVRFSDQSVCTHGFDHDVVTTVAAGTAKMLGPFPVSWFTKSCLIDYGLVGDGESVANKGQSPKISVFQLPAMSPGPGQG